MLAALAGDDAGAIGHWLFNGAAASLASWGVSVDDPPQAWRAAVPAAHRAFLDRLVLHHGAGGYLFVHAGIRPGVAIARQTREDLLWMREPFLSHRGDLGVVVVHGHTPAREPQVGQTVSGSTPGRYWAARSLVPCWSRHGWRSCSPDRPPPPLHGATAGAKG